MYDSYVSINTTVLQCMQVHTMSHHLNITHTLHFIILHYNNVERLISLIIGPWLDPSLSDEYTISAVHFDTFIFIVSNPALQSKTLTSHLSLGEATALLSEKTLTPKASSDVDICLASFGLANIYELIVDLPQIMI